MKSISILFLGLMIVKLSVAASSVFSCDQGCKDDSECPNDAHCVAVNQNSECGLCLCKAGYKTDNNQCVPNKKGTSHKGGKSNVKTETTTVNPISTTTKKTPAPVFTEAVVVSSTTSTSNNGPTGSTGSTASTEATTQGPPPAPQPIVCADYNCSPILPSSEDNPFTVRAAVINESSGCKNKIAIPGRPCNMIGGGVCYGEYCLTVDKGNDYCICYYNRVDRQCAVEKPGKCDGPNVTGQLPPNAYKVQNKRYRNKNNPDNGSIYARHFAATLDDCVKLCQWATGSCRSVNYGIIAGQNVCELLSTTVTKGSILEQWMVDAQGWQHAQVVTQI